VARERSASAAAAHSDPQPNGQACLDKLDGKITTEFWERKNAEWLEQEQQVQFALAGLRQANEPAQLLTASLTLELANKAYSLCLRQNR
jgi:hypothetical protein